MLVVAKGEGYAVRLAEAGVAQTDRPTITGAAIMTPRAGRFISTPSAEVPGGDLFFRHLSTEKGSKRYRYQARLDRVEGHRWKADRRLRVCPSLSGYRVLPLRATSSVAPGMFPDECLGGGWSTGSAESCVRGRNGEELQVHAVHPKKGRAYIRSHDANGVATDTLLTLPRCGGKP